jgi:hypothetical protein
MTVLFVCNQRKETTPDSPFNAAGFVSKYLATQAITTKVALVADADGVEAEINLIQPDVVVIESLWLPSEQLRDIATRASNLNRQFVVRIHNQLTFLAGEANALYRIMECDKIANVNLAANSRSLHADLLRLNLRSFFLPNICDLEMLGCQTLDKSGERVVNIACLGAVRLMKNQLAQAVAAIRFADKMRRVLRFHINVDTVTGIDAMLANLHSLFAGTPHELVAHPWMGLEDFVTLVRGMDLGMQVSFSETFNLISAHFVAAGVPILVSRQIDWMPREQQVDPSTTDDMEAGLRRFWGERREDICAAQERALQQYNAKAGRQWLAALSGNRIAE